MPSSKNTKSVRVNKKKVSIFTRSKRASTKKTKKHKPTIGARYKPSICHNKVYPSKLLAKRIVTPDTLDNIINPYSKFLAKLEKRITRHSPLSIVYSVSTSAASEIEVVVGEGFSYKIINENDISVIVIE